MLETINQSNFYIETPIIENFSRSRQRPQSYIGDLQEYWYDISFQLNPGKIEIAVFIHNLKKYDAYHIPLELRKISGEINCIANDTWRRKNVFSANLLFKDCCQLTSKASSILLSES